VTVARGGVETAFCEVPAYGPPQAHVTDIWGHPLEGSCQYVAPLPEHFFMLSLSCSRLQQGHFQFRALVLNHGSDSPITGTAPVTHQDQGKGALRLPKCLHAPGHAVAPENRRCQAMSTSEIHNSYGSPAGPTLCWLMTWAVSAPPFSAGGLLLDRAVANQVWWFSTNPFASSLPQPLSGSGKRFVHCKRHLIP